MIKGVERFFSFACLPFGFYDSARVITKVLRHVIEKWRQEGKTSFIHIDDGIIAFETEEEAKAGANEVQEDLEKFGLVISPEKCIWKPTQRLIWTGIEWDTLAFKCRIPEPKLKNAESKIQSLLSREGKKIPVKDLASCCGLLESFRQCVGEAVSRFKTRRMCIQIAQETEGNRWNCWIFLREDVIKELRYCIENLRIALLANTSRTCMKICTASI